ncbi:MAG: hypothetical protein BJ554DRAFT_6867 [Olpidium bornovanus]|uniref:Uncharacterized protein n=1 Tax=Olpidium bornovanus TaxID=278681 RepID=A0A8H7ZXK6_9FUNG|nr:MAG: hypothetical protein BJ554DRAFT_6867 [Olpidium bornovanus]
MTEYRKCKAHEDLASHAKPFQRVHQMFRRTAAEKAGEAAEDMVEETADEKKLDKLSAAKQKLRDGAAQIRNQCRSYVFCRLCSGKAGAFAFIRGRKKYYGKHSGVPTIAFNTPPCCEQGSNEKRKKKE